MAISSANYGLAGPEESSRVSFAPNWRRLRTHLYRQLLSYARRLIELARVWLRYRDNVSELSALTAWELEDLNIRRWEIKDLSWRLAQSSCRKI